MKRIVEVEIPDGLSCNNCSFFYWADGGFEQRCVLYDEDLESGRFNNQGVDDQEGKYYTKKCEKCLK